MIKNKTPGSADGGCFVDSNVIHTVILEYLIII